MNYDQLLAPAAKEMRPSGIRKFFDLAADMPHCISLGVGEPDFKTPWSIRDAGIRSLEQGKTKYTANAGIKELRAEICRYLARRKSSSSHRESPVRKIMPQSISKTKPPRGNVDTCMDAVTFNVSIRKLCGVCPSAISVAVRPSSPNCFKFIFNS